MQKNAIVDVAQGSPQNLTPYETVQLVEPVGVTADGTIVDADDPAAVQTVTEEVIPLGPQASQVAIKQLGTNGGGYNGVNSASPLENPSPLTNLIQCVSLLLIPVSLVFSFGRFVNDRRQGRALFAALFILLLAGLVAIAYFEQTGTPQLAQDDAVYMGMTDQSGGNMEGKEARFGVTDSSVWAAFTTAASNGAVNSMHDSYTPLGGMVPMILMALGEVVFGGVGCGLYSLIGFVLLTVFIAGLMVGRTPEYLGKKVEGREMKMAVLVLIIHPLLILGFSALAVGTEAGRAGITNPGFHGLSQVLYEYSSSAANNGSGFEGLADNTYFWNITAGLAMFFGRYLAIVLQLAIAWSLLCKKRMNESIGTLKTNNIGFGVIVAFVVYIFAALTFFPALALGPIAEHLSIWLPV